MGSTMLIDAAHPEETRVVVMRGNKIEEFDYESASRKPIRGNIYLAKVTRVEPSLQAAFVDYGGNRHGFLAFSEIHPDYYQIPVADRQALLEQEKQSRIEEDSDDDDEGEENGQKSEAAAANGCGNGNAEDASDDESDGGSVVEVDDDPEQRKVESVGADDALEEASGFTRKVKRVYKIQEVIKRRQILLVQVVKEERGNKGAALTTYLSLAGRYCVLMPNTARGGGISRKITDAGDRRRLKEVAREMEVPEGMGVIIRTAGANRTKVEIKRDYDYLLRQWESIRDLTLRSTAPALIYEEGSLIKRAIRDLYTKDVDEIIVEGAAAHREARDFMKMLMPSHIKNVKAYTEPRPLFSKHQVDSQLDSLFSPIVTLSSGGYLVINQTEALVSIDVNSGKSTREHNIEDTALKTNLEAADEVARQLRLRDLAGLIVIDFIDMEEKRNNRAVERRIKEALKNDRARIQVGRISHFGLLEMSRQRLRVGMLEGSTITCPQCQGRGMIRSVESCALSVLRSIEEHLIRHPDDITVRCDPQVGFYLLNQKRHSILHIENAYNVSIYLEPSADLHAEHVKIERAEGRPPRPVTNAVQVDTVYDDVEEVVEEEVEIEAEATGDTGEVEAEGEAEETTAAAAPAAAQQQSALQEGEENGRRRRRRRGRRGGRRNRGQDGLHRTGDATQAGIPGQAANGNQPQGEASSANEPASAEEPAGPVGDEARTGAPADASITATLSVDVGQVEAGGDEQIAVAVSEAPASTATEAAPRKSRRSRGRSASQAAAAGGEAQAPAEAEAVIAEPAPEKVEAPAEAVQPSEEPKAKAPRRSRAKSAKAAAEAGEDAAPAPKARSSRAKAAKAEGEAEPAKAKATRSRSRKTKADAAPANADNAEPASAAETEPVGADVPAAAAVTPAPAAAPAPAATPAPAAAPAPVAAQPAAPAAGSTPAPQKRGWWQRRLLGE